MSDPQDDKIVSELANAIYDTIEPLIKMCIEQRLRQILPLIKQGFTK
jgi:hypothetical protein